MATIIPRDNTNALQPIQDAINQRNQQQAALAQIAAQAKIQELMKNLNRQREAQAIEPIFPGQGEQLANMPKDVRGPYVKEQIAIPRRQAFGDVLAALAGGQQPGMPSNQQTGMPVQQQAGMQMPTRRSPSVIDPSAINWSAIPENQQMNVASLIQKSNRDAQAIEQKERFHADDNALKLMSIDQRIKESGDRKLGKIWSQISPRIRDANDKAKGSFEQINSLMNMKKMNDSGALNSQSYATILDMLGLGEYPALLDPTSQNYQEEMNSVIGSWSDLFPRGTQSEFQAFLTTQMPSLVKSQQGRDIIINRFLAANMAKQRYADIWNDTIEKYGENIPYDIEAKVEKKAIKAGRELYKSFAQGKMVDIPQVEGYEPLTKFTPEGQPIEEKKNEIAAPVQTQEQPQKPPESPKIPEQTPFGGPIFFPPEQNKQVGQEIKQFQDAFMQDVKALGARVGEGVGGVLGNIQSLGQGALALGSIPLNKLTGGRIPRIPFYTQEFQEKHPYLSAPTPEMLRKIDKIEPGTSAGEYISNMAGNLASAAVTGAGMGAGALNAIKGTVGGELARLGAKSLGFQELGQGIASAAGTLLGSSETVLPKLYDIATKGYANHVAKLSNISTNTDKYANFLSKLVPEKSPALKTKGMEKLAAKINDIKDLPTTVPATFWGNEIQTVNKLYDEIPKQQWHLLDNIKDFLDKEMNSIAKMSTQAAEGVEDFRLAQRAYAAASSGLKVRDFANQHIKGPLIDSLKDPVKAILGLGGFLSHPKKTLIAAGLGAGSVLGGVPLYNAIKIMHNHPEFKNLYLKALKNVAVNNGKNFLSAVKGMNNLA